jgi:hypothetical protein
MKTITLLQMPVVLLSMGLLLVSCKSSDAEFIFCPVVHVEYVDIQGNNIFIEDVHGFTILSITDNGKPYEYEAHKPAPDSHIMSIFISETFHVNTNISREYVIKYKVPSLFGEERVEELKLSFATNVPAGFTKAVYNGVEVTDIDSMRLSDVDANAASSDEDESDAIKYLHSGDLIAWFEGSTMYIIIPVPEAELLNK